MGQVQIGGVDPAHPYTSRSALATRSRPGRALTSLDLPSLTNVPSAARNVLLAARGFVGTPYVWGGVSPGGFDCSGFTRYVFGLVGVAIPRSSRAQLSAGDPVATQVSALMPGDLLFFANAPSEPISHVAIYAGEGRMIHASGSGRAVRVDDLITSRGRWFATHMVAARRVLPTPSSPGASQ
jgi:cell wall-associated NlpC family hydrolase